MTPTQLHDFRHRYGCIMADPRPDRESLNLLFAELMLAIVGYHERELRLIDQAGLRVVATECLCESARIEDVLPCGANVMPAEGICRLLKRRKTR